MRAAGSASSSAAGRRAAGMADAAVEEVVMV
jgi:hypothetical protein